ncbi:group 1 glycosyl transferase [Cyanosarcina cf. burmensis CCALA 770]|nr:group 1 glycosyl transferase [Cyanosarcina cf. burmensis CCALA 770]
MKPLAIVIPWFGKALKGGAEQQAWQIASRLVRRGHKVEIITTCCQAFDRNWAENHYKPGLSQEDGIAIRRFKVVRTDHDAFNQVNHLMLRVPPAQFKPGVSPVSLDDATIFCTESISSPQLLHFLKTHHHQYQAFLFIPYLYGPILNGLSLVADRAFLQPCLHDEAYAYLPQVEQMFHLARGLLFNSEGEEQLAKKLYGAGIIPKSYVVGEGIEVGQHDDPTLSHIGNLALKKDRYILYLGRRDATKNTDFLVRAYAIFKQKYPDSSLQLILAGSGETSFHDAAPGLTDLGLVSESEKEALLANCLALFQPSRNESYSRVMMEAWFYGRPVVVHQDCLATASAVKSARGGWLAATEIEWAEMFAQIDRAGMEQLAEYGANGQNYARKNASWDGVIDRYETILGLTAIPATSPQPQQRQLKEIHQLMAGFSYGDAISNHARWIRNYLQALGYKSEIFAEHLDPRATHEAKRPHAKSIGQQAGLIYHHSIGCEVTEYAIAHPSSKCLIYHNITPAEFFRSYRPDVAQLLEQGRAELNQLAQHFPLSVGVSTYNASELAESGFTAPGVLPIPVDPKKWDMAADPQLMQQLQDGKTNLLFVGRVSPHKRQDHLLEAFAHYLTMDREARLILIGGGDINDPYYHHVTSLMHRLHVTNYVMIPGQVNDAQLLAFYRTAHLFWSMSEHEGFCVPLVEAMWFDVPILAYKSSAIPETLGKAGLMFTNKENLIEIAALAKILVKDNPLREKVLTAQRQQRNKFSPPAVIEKLNKIVLMMEENFSHELSESTLKSLKQS